MFNRIKKLLVKITILFAIIFFPSYISFAPEYKLTLPEKRFVLPPVLNEISGITYLNENEIACVQDEMGTIFIYDLNKGEITKEYNTHLIGDYEGIALVNKTLFLLRSDGALIECSDYRSSKIKIKEHLLNLPSGNNEGLCYDEKNNRLLIAAKTKAGSGSENKNTRYIYSFDLKTSKPDKTPVLKLNIESLMAKAVESNIPIPYRTNKKTGTKINMFNFRPSAIAIHPIDKMIYVLSANDKLMLIMDPDGDIQKLIRLDVVLFNKAEGMTFYPNGDMLISNEAQKGRPTLLRFDYNK